ncbi:MAG: hypothetical protein Fur0046_03790 [Cyanobacteria bacterium J069]|nr:MAG: septal ring lytic transglycosylase RlpA family protein [Cyanobacteria bacterium J069]
MLASADGAKPGKAARCQTGLLADDLCQAVQWRSASSVTLWPWGNVRLMSPWLRGRSPKPLTTRTSLAADDPAEKEISAPARPEVEVVVRSSNAPAAGSQRVFKQCIEGALQPAKDSEAIKHGSTQQTAAPPPASVRPEAAVPHQVWVGGQVVMELPDHSEATRVAQQLKSALNAPGFAVDQLRLVVAQGKPSVTMSNAALKSSGNNGEANRLLFSVDPSLAASLRRTADLVAIDWFNNLRVALGVEPLSLMEAQADLYSLTQTERSLGGITSWYGPGFHNRLTANGERFNQYALTAAHPKLPFNTYLRVTNVRNGASVVVRINDRGPYIGRRSLDLSRQAARCIGSEKPGVVRYEAVILEPQTTVQ